MTEGGGVKKFAGLFAGQMPLGGGGDWQASIKKKREMEAAQAVQGPTDGSNGGSSNVYEQKEKEEKENPVKDKDREAFVGVGTNGAGGGSINDDPSTSSPAPFKKTGSGIRRLPPPIKGKDNENALTHLTANRATPARSVHRQTVTARPTFSGPITVIDASTKGIMPNITIVNKQSSSNNLHKNVPNSSTPSSANRSIANNNKVEDNNNNNKFEKQKAAMGVAKKATLNTNNLLSVTSSYSNFNNNNDDIITTLPRNDSMMIPPSALPAAPQPSQAQIQSTQAQAQAQGQSAAPSGLNVSVISPLSSPINAISFTNNSNVPPAEVESLKNEITELRRQLDDFLSGRVSMPTGYISTSSNTDPSPSHSTRRIGALASPTNPVSQIHSLTPSNSNNSANTNNSIQPREVSSSNSNFNSNGSNERVFMSGWMEKEGENVKSWKRRWMVLYRTRLEYFEKQTDQKPKGSILLNTSCSILPMKKRPGVDKPCLEIIVSNRKWHITADTAAENATWYSCIMSRIMACSYTHRCEMMKASPDLRIIDFLDNAASRRRDSKLPGAGVPLCMNFIPFTMDGISVLARILGDPALAPLSSLELTYSSLTHIEFELLVNAYMQHQTSTLSLVNFSGNKIGGTNADGYRALGRLLCKTPSTLQHVLLHDCGLEADGIDVLAGTIESFDNSPQASSNTGGPFLSSTSPLNRLVLSSNKLGDNGIMTLCVRVLTIPSFSFVGHLDLERNHITDEGAHILAGWLEQQNSLLYLNLRDNNIADKGACALAESIQKNEVLLVFDISLNERLTDIAGQELSYMCQINTSLEEVKFLNYYLDLQGLTVMRLMYKYGEPPAPPPK